MTKENTVEAGPRGVVLITGASSGIGRELAALFVKGGYEVYGVSRSGISEDGVRGLTCDVTSEEDCAAAVAAVVAAAGRLDILVNNAGMGIAGAVEDTSAKKAKYIFDVNFFGAFHMIKYALPHLRAVQGRIVNISSVASKIAVPFQAFYSATKAAMDSLASALRGEVKRFGVKVVNILPGDAKTGFTDSREAENPDAAYAEAYKKSIAVMEKDERNGMSALAVARTAFRVSVRRHPPRERVAGTEYRLFVILAKFLPKSLTEKIVQSIY
ncbi:MAG: SDR family NAD(P)-dependent oxidoreductase [Clostridiales bacterium]|jgi:NAD(P)-dependent dehydrogenase (short-subunit alcohol dehydrogenase family)|nr:SDR family NAD(P)-dependent oxidoreductase [Clostridiales bacterium]